MGKYLLIRSKTSLTYFQIAKYCKECGRLKNCGDEKRHFGWEILGSNKSFSYCTDVPIKCCLLLKI